MNSEKDSEEKKKLISKNSFYFEIPLYDLIAIENFEDNILSGDVDAYSALNGIDTTYKISATRIDSHSFEDFYDYYQVTLICKRKDNDILRYILLIKDNFLIKIGQFPSLADIQFAKIGKKYDKVLLKDDLHEFKKAIGLSAHGAGAGSFVYLRRIFEKLILRTFNANLTKLNITEEFFKLQRMTDKVKILKDYLPEQLFEMKEVYAILSSGVHELTEDQCRSYFPALKLSIELILEGQIEMEKKKKKDEQVKSAIKQISQDLNK